MAMGSWFGVEVFFSSLLREAKRARRKKKCELWHSFFSLSFFSSLRSLTPLSLDLEDLKNSRSERGGRRFLLGKTQPASLLPQIFLCVSLHIPSTVSPRDKWHKSKTRTASQRRKKKQKNGRHRQERPKGSCPSLSSLSSPSLPRRRPQGPHRLGGPSRRRRREDGQCVFVPPPAAFFFLLPKQTRGLPLSPLFLLLSSFSVAASLSPTHKQAATTDLDALEKCVSSVAYGDLDAEPRGKLSEVKRRRDGERAKKKKRGGFFSLGRISKVSSAFFSYFLSFSFYHHSNRSPSAACSAPRS